MTLAVALLIIVRSSAAATGCDTWIGGSGNFGTAADWSTGLVPTSSDDACINATTSTTPPAAADSYTVTISSANYSVNSLTLGGPAGHQILAIPNLDDGLTIASASAINTNGELDLGGGAGGHAHVDGGGTLSNSGSVITSSGAQLHVNFDNLTGGTVEISQSTAVDTGTTFTNDGGALTVDAGKDLHLSGGSEFDNLAGTITIIHTGELQVSQGTFKERSSGAESGDFVTMGGGPGSVLDDDTTAGSGGFYFTNETGFSTLTGTGASPGVASGQTIVIQNNNMELDLGKNLTNAGTIDVSDSSVGGYGRLGTPSQTLTNTGAINTGTISALRVNIDNKTSGTVEIIHSAAMDAATPTTFTNDGGALTIDASQSLHLSGGSEFDNLAGTITNGGELKVSQGTFKERSSGAISGQVTMGGGTGSVLDDDTTAGSAGFYFINESGGSTLTGTGGSPGVASGQSIVIKNDTMELDLGADIADHGTITVSDESVGGTATLGNANHALTIEPSGGTVTVGGHGVYTQGSLGTLGVTVDATGIGTNTGITGGAGTANLAGTLAVTTLGTPALNSTWTVVNVGSVSGTFPTHSFGGVPYSVSYPSGQVVLTTPGLSSTTTQPSTTTGTLTAVPVTGVPLGTTVYDEATVTGNSSTQSPAGMVTFYECGPAASGCTSGGSTVGSPVTVTPGSSGTAVAFSAGFMPPSAGTWCFAGYYGGDGTFPASSDTSNDECFIVTAPTTTVSQITPTGTTCSQFVAGAATLDRVTYSVKRNQISQVAPGVFFYWVKITATSGTNTFTITQTRNETSRPLLFAAGSFAYDSSCTTLSTKLTESSSGTVTVTFNAHVSGTAYLGIKFSTSNVVGEPPPGPSSTVTYTYTTTGVPGSTSSINLVKVKG